MYSGVRADVSQAVLRGRVDARRAWGSVALQLDQSPVAANRSMRTARKPSITSKQRLRPFGASFGTPPNASSPSYGGQHPAINTKTAAHSAVQQRNSAASGGYRGVQSAESQSQRQRPRQSAQSPPKPLHPAANVTSVTPSKARANKGTNKSRSSPTNQTQTQSRKKPAGSVAARQPTATSNSKPQQESPPRKRSAIAAALSLAPKHAEVTSPASKPRNTTPTDTASQATSAPQSRSSASAPIIDTQSTLPFPPAQLQESVYARGKYFQNREALQVCSPYWHYPARFLCFSYVSRAIGIHPTLQQLGQWYLSCEVPVVAAANPDTEQYPVFYKPGAISRTGYLRIHPEIHNLCYLWVPSCRMQQDTVTSNAGGM